MNRGDRWGLTYIDLCGIIGVDNLNERQVMAKHIDYLVELDGDDTKDEFVNNIRTAKKVATDMAKRYGRTAYIQKFRDEVPDDFCSPSHWAVEPNGRITAG